jgi:hypothetical protein
MASANRLADANQSLESTKGRGIRATARNYGHTVARLLHPDGKILQVVFGVSGGIRRRELDAAHQKAAATQFALPRYGLTYCP